LWPTKIYKDNRKYHLFRSGLIRFYYIIFPIVEIPCTFHHEHESKKKTSRYLVKSQRLNTGREAIGNKCEKGYSNCSKLDFTKTWNISKDKSVHTKIKFLNRILKRNHRQDFNVQCGFQYSRYTFLGVHQFELTWLGFQFIYQRFYSLKKTNNRLKYDAFTEDIMI